MTTTNELRDDITSQFTTTYDAVNDLGWDPNGVDPITVPFENNTLIEVPPGTYYIDTKQSGSPTAFGIVGQGTTPEDVTFVGPDGQALRLLEFARGSRDILIENVSLDHQDTIAGCAGMAFLVEAGFLVHDVHYLGTTPDSNTGSTELLPFYIFETDGVAILDGVEMLGPSELADYPDCPLAIFAGQEHAGTAYIRNSRVANRGEHAIYASRCSGDIRIEDCWFKNNQNTQARIAGEGSYCKDSEFHWNTADHPNIGDFQATTGLTFESGQQGYTGGLVERCEFVVEASANNSGCLKIDGSHGGMTARACTFDIRDDVTPILAQAPGDSHMIDGTPDKPHELTFDHVHVTSVGEPDFWGDAAVTLDGRDNTLLNECCISADGRDGLHADDGVYEMQSGALETTGGRPRVAGTGDIRLYDVSYEADCAVGVAALSAAADNDNLAAPFATRDGVWAVLEAADGQTTVVADGILGGSLELRHTAISTADIEVPPRERTPGLVLGRAEVYYQDSQLFAGEIGTVPGPSTGDTQTIQVRGPAAAIDGGDLSLSVTNRAARDVIRDVWAERTPFEFTVHDPPDDRATFIGAGKDDDGEFVPFETSGTVLSVLQDLHDRAGMRFTVRHDQSTPERPVVESYVPSEEVRDADWTHLDHDSQLNPDGYANKVTVYGRKPDDPTEPRPQSTAEDREEIDRYGVYPRPGGLVIWDSELTTSADCRERAQSVRDDSVDEISLAGSVEIIPELVHPGYHRPVPSLDDELEGDTLALDRVSMSLLGDSPTATLEFAASDSLADKLVAVSRQANRANRLL